MSDLENLRNRHSYPSRESGERFTTLTQHNRYTPQDELREAMGELGNLTHPEALGDTGHPIFYNLLVFPRRHFACFLYHHEGGGYP